MLIVSMLIGAQTVNGKHITRCCCRCPGSRLLIPAFLGLWTGRRLLKIDKPILIGAIAGQQCSTPAMHI